jgi:hypothetical protein
VESHAHSSSPAIDSGAGRSRPTANFA